jgi:hypothetical protein
MFLYDDIRTDRIRRVLYLGQCALCFQPCDPSEVPSSLQYSTVASLSSLRRHHQTISASAWIRSEALLTVNCHTPGDVSYCVM